MAVLLTPPSLQFFDDNGVPLAGGFVYTYASGTTTPKATYTNSAGSVAASNPIELDSAGRATIWISGTYTFIVKDSNGNTITTTDNVTAFTALPTSSDSYFETFSGTGAQTAFTTSEDLGTDEKALFVWVNGGGGEGYNIQNPSTYTINGTSLTFSVAPASGTNNIYVSAPSLQVGAASSAAADAAASAADAAADAVSTAADVIAADSSASDAADSAAEAAASAAKLYGTSTTSLAIAVASKVFTTQADKFFDVGSYLLITSDAAATNYMHGQVTSYSGTSLTVNVTNIGGSGTYADWTIRVSGTRGATGATGATGSISDFSGVPSGTVATADKMVFSDVTDSDIVKTCLVSDIITLAQTTILAAVYPVGSYYINETSSTNPATLLGFGTWSAVTDKFIVGHGSTYTSTGGAATVTLSASNLPPLDVAGNYYNSTSAIAGQNCNSTIKVMGGAATVSPLVNVTVSGAVNPSGSSTAFSIIPPYQAAYIWKRTA